MNINITKEDLMNDEVFKRLIILTVAPSVCENSDGTYYSKAQETCAFADGIVQELKRKQK